MLVALALCACSFSVFAATVTIAQFNTPPGAAIMLPVSYSASGAQSPATLVIRLSYSTTYLEAIEIVPTSLLADNNKTLEYELYPGGIDMVIFGGATLIPSGTLCHLHLSVDSETPLESTLPITDNGTNGADSDAKSAAIQVNDGYIYTQDGDLQVTLMDIELEGGQVAEWPAAIAGGTGELSIQWFRLKEDESWAQLVEFSASPFSGTRTDTLIFSPFSAPLAGLYKVEVSDDETTVDAAATATYVPPVPTGGLALAAFALASAFGGAMALRRRK